MKLVIRILVLIAPILLILITLGFVSMLMSQHKNLEKRNGEDIKTFVTEYIIAKQTNEQLHIESQGLVEPKTQIDLISEVGGIIIYLSDQFQKGARFKKRDTLLRIEDKDYKSLLLKKKANLKLAEQALIREQAEADIALQDWKEYGDQQKPSDLALRKPQLEQARAQMLAEQAEVRNAEIQLERTIIKAPFSGQVRTKNVDIGQYVGIGKVLGRIFFTDILQVELPLTDHDLSLLGIPITFQASKKIPGPNVTLYGNIANKTHYWAGELTRIDSVLDNETRTIQAIIEIKIPYNQPEEQTPPLIPGLFVHGIIDGRKVNHIFILPASALREKNLIYKINDQNEIVILKTNVIAIAQDKVFVKGNIKSGDKIAITPFYNAYTGMKVTPILKENLESNTRVLNINNDYITQ